MARAFSWPRMFRAMVPSISKVLLDFQMPVRVGEAEQYLHQIRSSIDYLVMYRSYFPTEYEQSMERVRAGRASLFPQRGEAYSQHEIQFLKLVDRDLFPLPLYYVLDDIDEDSRCYRIPIEPFGIDLIERQDVLDMDLGWQLMYYLIGDFPQDVIAGAFKEDPDAIFTIPFEQGRADDQALRDLCGTRPPPLAFFRHAIDMIDHDTGTVWLDATMEVPCTDADWSKDNIDELARQYQEALAIKEKADQFINWLEADPATRFKEVIDLWNECVIQTRPRWQIMRR